ncbi:MAG TPA: hypothetical protein ENI51_06060 [Candidatus Atribacteria bacterium]|nr:hypothetical protein [Candidatus Atribacteria bacterium]
MRTLLKELEKKGIKVKLFGDDRLWIGPKDKITDEVREKVKQHKAELIYSLQKVNTKETTTYQGHTYDQLCQIFTILLKQYGGYILVKSAQLDDEVIAFSLPQYLKKLSEQGYVCYLPFELATLLIKQPTPDALKRAHRVKKFFEGRIVLQ